MIRPPQDDGLIETIMQYQSTTCPNPNSPSPRHVYHTPSLLDPLQSYDQLARETITSYLTWL